MNDVEPNKGSPIDTFIKPTSTKLVKLVPFSTPPDPQRNDNYIYQYDMYIHIEIYMYLYLYILYIYAYIGRLCLPVTVTTKIMLFLLRDPNLNLHERRWHPKRGFRIPIYAYNTYIHYIHTYVLRGINLHISQRFIQQKKRSFYPTKSTNYFYH